MNEKRFICVCGQHSYGDSPIDNSAVHQRLVEEVVLRGVPETERLTPKLAAQAARVAFGHRNGVTVTSGGYGYRLYANSARKIRENE